MVPSQARHTQRRGSSPPSSRCRFVFTGTPQAGGGNPRRRRRRRRIACGVRPGLPRHAGEQPVRLGLSAGLTSQWSADGAATTTGWESLVNPWLCNPAQSRTDHRATSPRPCKIPTSPLSGAPRPSGSSRLTPVSRIPEPGGRGFAFAGCHGSCLSCGRSSLGS